MIIIGLTGGIASGKTFVAQYLKNKNIPTHESDKVISDFYKKPKKKFIDFLKKNGFEDALKKNKIDKKIIREKIFNNKQKKQKLENYLHGIVELDRKRFLKTNKKKNIVFLDIPLLFENNLQYLCDLVCSTIAPKYLREKRALKRQGMNKSILKLIFKNQTNDKIRKSKSDFLIYTSLSKTKTYLQIDNMIYDIYKIKNERNCFRY